MESVSLIRKTLFIEFLLVKEIMTHKISSLLATGLIICKVWVIRLDQVERDLIKKKKKRSLPQVQKSLRKLYRVGELQLRVWGVTVMAQHGGQSLSYIMRVSV